MPVSRKAFQMYTGDANGRIHPGVSEASILQLLERRLFLYSATRTTLKSHTGTPELQLQPTQRENPPMLLL